MTAKTKAVRADCDFYPTPAWVTRSIVPYLGGHLPVDLIMRAAPLTFLEPAAGDGALIKAVIEMAPWAASAWSFCEIRPVAYQALAAAGHKPVGPDYLSAHPPKELYSVAITNPPFVLCEQFARKMRKEAHVVALLTRLNFLGSQKRAQWMREDTPSVYVLSKRPSFTGGGTDSTEYCWMIWSGEPKQRGDLVVLELPPEEE